MTGEGVPEPHRDERLQAIQTDRTLTAVIEDALRIALDGSHAGITETGDDLPVDGSGGPLPGIDLDDTSMLLDRMEELE